MCGIFGYAGKKTKAAEFVFAGLKSLEYRGYDSWGIAAISTQNTISVKKKTGKIGAATIDEFGPSNFAFGHTRWATHGGVTEVNSHPHLDCIGNFAIVHNGIIENYEKLKKDLQKKGHKIISETDSEIAIHLIEEYAKTLPFSEAVRKAFLQFSGLNAIIVMSVKDRQFVAARSGSPLVIGFGTDENFIASDALALLRHTKRVYFLEDNEYAVVSKNSIRIADISNNQKKIVKPTTLNWKISETTKGNFPYFMLKEIYEQPEMIERIALTPASDIEKWVQIIKKAKGTYLIGCGSAYHACIAGSYIFSHIAKFHINPAVASEFGYQLDFLTKKSLVIALSQSGETMDTLEAVKKAKAAGAKIGAFVNVAGSTLYREADYKLPLTAGPEKGVATTKAFTAKISFLLLIAYALSGNLNQGRKLLKKAARSSRKLLEKETTNGIKNICKKLQHKEHLYVIGRCLSYTTALESALKIKEISYIHAEGFAAGELKHGVLALIEKNTPCLVFAPSDETEGANIAGAMEMKARGGDIIAVASHSHEVFDEYLKVNDCKEATIIPNVIMSQLFGYYMATARGLDPDMPRNLAKSVTVK